MDGPAAAARFNSPSHLALQLAADGTAHALFVSDRDNHALRRVELASGAVKTIACRENNQPTGAVAALKSASVVSAPSSSASAPLFLPLNSPAGVLLDPLSQGSYVLLADGGNHLVRIITLPSAASRTIKAALWAGGAEGKLGWENEGEDEISDEPAAAASPQASVITAPTEAVVTPVTSRRRMAMEARLAEEAAAASNAEHKSDDSSRPSTGSASRSSLLASQPALPSISALSAKFSHPAGLCWDSSSNVFLADKGNRRLKKIGTTGRLTHVPDAEGFELRLQAPECVIQDARGNLVFTDSKAHCIKRITPEGVVSILAGSPREAGFVDGPGSVARFRSPYGLALDPKSNAIFVSDEENHCVRIVSAKGEVRTIAGGGKEEGDAAEGVSSSLAQNATKPSARPMSASTQRSYSGRAPPVAAAVAGSSSSADSLEENEPQEGFRDGSGIGSRFFRPRGLAFDAQAGVLYVADSGNHAIRALRIDASEGFAALVPQDPFPSARLMPAATSASDANASVATSRMNRHASMPSFHSPLISRVNAYGHPTVPAGRPASGSSQLSALGRKAASSATALAALQSVALPADPRAWTKIDVSFWLVGLNPAFDNYIAGFRRCGIDGRSLMDRVTDALLAAPAPAAGAAATSSGVGISSKMHRNAILREILRLKNPGDEIDGEDEAGEELDAAVRPVSSEGGGSRGSSASSTRPQTALARPTTAGGWRPSSAHLSDAAETFLTTLHMPLEPQTDSEAAVGAATQASAASLSNVSSAPQQRFTPSPPPRATVARALDVPASSGASSSSRGFEEES